MPLQRKQVGAAHAYRGRQITAQHMGPDLIGFVNDVELSGFYLDLAAVRAAGERYVDAEEKAKDDLAKKTARG